MADDERDFTCITIRWDQDYGGLIYDLDGCDEFSAIAMLDHVRACLIDNLPDAVTAEQLVDIDNDDE